jgi:bacteriocin biosynthesis cyclodehydratase domain-containing protein
MTTLLNFGAGHDTTVRRATRRRGFSKDMDADSVELASWPRCLEAMPGVQLVLVADDRVVVKCGLTEMLVSGPSVAPVVERLLVLLDGSRDVEAILTAFPAEISPVADELLSALEARQLLRAVDPVSAPAPDRSAIQPMLEQLGLDAGPVVARLAAAHVTLVGRNRVAMAIAADLAELGVGNIGIVAHPQLDTLAETPGFARVTDEPDLVIATSELGRSEAFFTLNRNSVAAERPFLPAWIVGAQAYIGPLVVPGESACLRCADLTGTPRDHGRELPEDGRTDAIDGASNGTSPPVRNAAVWMGDLVGHVVAAEVFKYLVRTLPSDVTGRLIRLDLGTSAGGSFGGGARRVMKVPRCPDCSDAARHGAPAVLAGPQIPMRWVGLHE